jgi:putative peptide zinc metalloprotease protein
LSDALAVENLQSRSFALLRHYFRTCCCGLADPDPEPALNNRLRRGMAVYAVGALIYRLILAIAIGVLLYYFAFKLLGILALVAVLIVMVIQPALKEARSTFNSGARLVQPGRLVILVMLLSVGVALAFYPWQNSVSAPSILKASAKSHIYAPYAAKLATVDVAAGDRVSEGDVIATLASPEIEYRLGAARARAESFRLVVERIGFRKDIADQEAIVRQQWAKAIAEAEGYKAQLDALVLQAPFDGTIAWMSENARPGGWVRPNSALSLVVDVQTTIITAYLEESYLARIDLNAAGKFYAFGDTGAALKSKVISIAPAAIRTIRDRGLASVYAGPIPARQTEDGSIIPEAGLYEVRLALTGNPSGTRRETMGVVRIDARRESIAKRIWRQVNTVLVREHGF